MNVFIKEGFIMVYSMDKMTMSDGNITVLHNWLPEGEVKGVVVLSHGMAEHATRYERFASLLTEEGFALYAEDHRGHGETAKLASEKGTGALGYLADKDGFFRVVDDIHEEVEMLHKKYPDKKIFLFGHSFGSFISQCFIEKYGSSINGCILCGTAGPRNAMVKAAKIVGNVIRIFTGKRHISHLMDKMAFGAYNAKIQSPRTPFDWLSRDEKQVDAYIADDFCGFVCTIGFFCDMFAGLSFIHTRPHIAMIPLDLPVHFIDGTGDPVGDYSKTVQNLYDIYCSNGMKDVSIKLFTDARHELLNEINKEEVEQDVIAWLKSH